ncbi:hypothetical protein BS47DRAFT_1370799 [Hydnum rufescens UP504]|uniref:GPN-loop GTPase 3 n=1 Tax=Hydnum rufescens UP504 TaxID=1448309 RepID=A0A9P6B7G3_9AGAM|nr:hypothetical protein BS47DRAFT_1370799 [Hydnum rufescens UP504]
MRYAVLVCGPAGSGKSTFCTSMLTNLEAQHRTCHLVNLDPAADSTSFEYEPSIDIRDLISLDDVMSELGYGPNGGLVYCFEYLLQNMDWLDEELGEFENNYLLIDCPGQIELYTHHPLLPALMSHLAQSGIRTCALYLVESQFMEDRYKYFSGVMSAMSAMVNFEIPWINVLSKMDLVTPTKNDDDPDGAGARNGPRGRRDIARFLDPDPMMLLASEPSGGEKSNPRFHALNQAIAQLIEDHPLVSFLPLDLTSTKSLETIISHVDYTIQYGEDEEPREPKDMDEGDFPDIE